MVKDEKMLPREQRESIQNLRQKIKIRFETELELLHAQKFIQKLYDLQNTELEEERKKTKPKSKNKVKPRKRPNRILTEDSPENSEIAIRVHDLCILDQDYDPLPVFLVRSTYGSHSAMVYKRYDQFEELHSELSPKNLAAQLPTKEEAFKEDTSDLLTQLTKYMLVILKEKRIARSKTLRSFLGHSVDGDEYSEIFDWAMKRITSFTHNIIYHDPVEGLTKFIVTQVCYEDDTVKRPDAKDKQEFLEFLRIVMKSTAENVGEFWFETKKNFETVELSLNSFSDMKMLLDEYWGYVGMVQASTRDKIAPYLKEFHTTVNVVMREMMPSFKYLFSHLIDLVSTCGQLAEEITNPEVPQISDEVETKLYDMKRIIRDFPPELYDKMGEIAGHISPPFTKLRLFFTCFDHIAEGLVGFFQVRNIITVMNEMLARKVGMVKDEDVSKKKMDMLEDQLSVYLWRFERDGEFDVWRCFYEINKKVSQEYQAMSPDEKIQMKEYFQTLTDMIVTVSDHCLTINKILLEGLRKLWWKAMDYLSAKTMNKRKKEFNISEVMKEAFQYGLVAMTKHWKKRIMMTMADCLSSLFAKSVREDIMDQCQARQTHIEISEQYIKIMPFELVVLNAFHHMLQDEIKPTVSLWINFFIMKDVKVISRAQKESLRDKSDAVVRKKDENESAKKIILTKDEDDEILLKDEDMLIKDKLDGKDKDDIKNESGSPKIEKVVLEEKTENSEGKPDDKRSVRTTRTEMIDDDELTFDCEVSDVEKEDEDEEKEDDDEDDTSDEEKIEKKENVEDEPKKVETKTKEAYGFGDLSSKTNFSTMVHELNLDLTETSSCSSGDEALELL
ncbi:hypothetical protein EIN_267230 [Entamoeba invadens IP1]|uniref:PX domain-containing protein n=1 Tax=Entamoeba invadens IP1 TaxID=370355 RepID=A0A0A1UBH5_ENTIV|nr:hypothetical protein EIN_267230 [Entamoeba invadens IP1]ELP91017.1 hypothetical protein EIN_267230 [Entamoeba invadens IP1]|eukprot:XP_004257788.1 hypothetical protein EIN_267230 [Entamoeba invadens IP1]